MAVEVGHERPDLQPVVRGQRRRIDPRAGDGDHAQAGDEIARDAGNAAMTRSSSDRPTPEPPTVTMHTCSAGA